MLTVRATVGGGVSGAATIEDAAELLLKLPPAEAPRLEEVDLIGLVEALGSRSK